ncbi:unnamed protein product [Prunus armeniaca]
MSSPKSTLLIGRSKRTLTTCTTCARSQMNPFRDYIKRFKAEEANIVWCDNQIASSAFKKGLPAEQDLYRELTITPSQTLAKVFATAERYVLWDDDRIAAKKSTEQEDQPTKWANQRSDRLGSKDKDKHKSRP